MSTTKQKPIGLTKQGVFQIGVRKTFPIAVETAWDFLFSKKGLNIWLGKINPENLDHGRVFETDDGIEGRIRVFKLHSHIRMNWKSPDWDNISTLQIRVIPNGNKTTISFHQENLLDESQRKQMKEYWTRVLDRIKNETLVK